MVCLALSLEAAPRQMIFILSVVFSSFRSVGIRDLRTAKDLYALDTCRAAGFHGKNGGFCSMNLFPEPVIAGFKSQLHTFAGRAVDAPGLECLATGPAC